MSAITNAFQALSDLSLWLKVNASDSITLSDMPALIKLRIKSIVEQWEDIKVRIKDKQDSYSDPARLQSELDSFSDQVSILRVRPAALDSISDNDMLSKYFTVLDNILIADLEITPQEAKIISSELDRVDAFTLNTFKSYRSLMIEGRDAIADNIGGSDSTYNAVYGRSSLPKLLDKSTQQIGISNQLQIGISTIDALIANNVSVLQSTAIVDPFAFARANANNPNFDIRSFSSGKLVRLNYGESLQTLALRVMGDENRWMEIAIANGLKPPYIDEVGQSLSLIANGKGTIINIARVDGSGNLNKEKFFINQILIIQSDTEKVPDQRVVLSITEVPVSGELVIELTGNADLDKYKIADNARVRVFKPNTVNSNFFILIPSNEPQPISVGDETPWFLRSKGEDEKNAGTDIFLDDSGDISFNAFGDFQLSYGAANALQALKILLSTEQGSLRQHGSYGLVSIAGEKNQNPAQIRQAIAESVSDQILNDPRFDRLDYLSVESIAGADGKPNQPSGYKVSVGVVLSGGGNNVIPISFRVNTPES